MLYKSNVSGKSFRVSVDSPNKGYFMFVEVKPFMELLLVHATGESRQLMKVQLAIGDIPYLVVHSNAHERFSVCWTRDEVRKHKKYE